MSKKPGTVAITLFVLTLSGFLVLSFITTGNISNANEPVEELSPEGYASPIDIISDRTGKRLFLALHTAGEVAVWDTISGEIAERFQLQEEVRALALSPDENRLYAAAGGARGRLHAINLDSGQSEAYAEVGHTPSSIAVCPDSERVYVANRFESSVSVVDPESLSAETQIPVSREPVGLVLSKDGSDLYAVGHLPAGPASANHVAAEVTVIDTDSNEGIRNIKLTNGSSGIRGVTMCPEGDYIYITHILARFQYPVTQLDRGWVNTNAMSIIDMNSQELKNTVLLDDVDYGAANPWGIDCTEDGNFLLVSHAGTNELSVIDRKALHQMLDMVEDGEFLSPIRTSIYTPSTQPGPVYTSDVPNDLSFLKDIRVRVTTGGIGPRALKVINDQVYIGHYFSDSLCVMDAEPFYKYFSAKEENYFLPDADYHRVWDYTPAPVAQIESFELGSGEAMTAIRKGEMFFNDATYCYQQWQSCASCHPDARVDGFNWDLLNDGIGNPTITRSLVMSHDTPPVMITGVRPNAEIAVRAGVGFIGFAVVEEEYTSAVDEYLMDLQPLESPYLEDGELSSAAQRGEIIFEEAGCISCHSGEYLAGSEPVDVGTKSRFVEHTEFVPPALRELWRTAPYLHDGRTMNLRDVFDEHGMVSKLTSELDEEDISDLKEYLLSL